MNTSASPSPSSRWLAIALAMIASVVIALLRYYPLRDMWNFAAVGALSLFVGARVRSWWALALPLGLMLATDCWLSVAKPENTFPYPDMAFTYCSYVAIFAMGYWLGQTENPLQLGAISVGASVLFFLVTNFGSWLIVAVLHAVPVYPGFNDYEPNLGGLLLSYERGLPFYSGTLAGDVVFAAALFGAYAVLVRWVAEPQARTEEVWS